MHYQIQLHLIELYLMFLISYFSMFWYLDLFLLYLISIMLKQSINQIQRNIKKVNKYDKNIWCTSKHWSAGKPNCSASWKINVYLNVRWNTLKQPWLWRQLTILSPESFWDPLISPHDLQPVSELVCWCVLTFPLCLVMRLLRGN